MFNKDTMEVLFGIAFSFAIVFWLICFLIKGMPVIAFLPPIIFEIVRVHKERKYWLNKIEHRL